MSEDGYGSDLDLMICEGKLFQSGKVANSFDRKGYEHNIGVESLHTIGVESDSQNGSHYGIQNFTQHCLPQEGSFFTMNTNLPRTNGLKISCS